MWHSTDLEGVNVTLDGGEVDTDLLGAGQEHLRVVDTLGSGHDLFTADEYIIRIRVSRVLRILHGIEGANVGRELVDDVEILLVFTMNNLTKNFLILSGDILGVAVVGDRGKMGT